MLFLKNTTKTEITSNRIVGKRSVGQNYSSDKIDEILGWCRKFRPTKIRYFEKKYAQTASFLIYCIKLLITFGLTFLPLLQVPIESMKYHDFAIPGSECTDFEMETRHEKSQHSHIKVKIKFGKTKSIRYFKSDAICYYAGWLKDEISN